MKLEFLTCINEEKDNVLRLFNFNDTELNSLIFLIKENLVENSKSLRLDSINFIFPINCKLELELSDINTGVERIEGNNFKCYLTKEEYERMIELIYSLVGNEYGYQWLYDVDNPYEFLLSKSGLW